MNKVGRWFVIHSDRWATYSEYAGAITSHTESPTRGAVSRVILSNGWWCSTFFALSDLSTITCPLRHVNATANIPRNANKETRKHRFLLRFLLHLCLDLHRASASGCRWTAPF